MRSIPGIVFGGTGERWNLETKCQLHGTKAPKAAGRSRPRGLDAAARVLQGRSARVVLREPVPLQEHRWREELDADQPGPHARRSGHSRTLDAEAAAHIDRNGKRGVIYTMHRRRCWCRSSGSAPMMGDPRTTGRWADVAERHACSHDAVEPRDDDRGVALQCERRVCERRPASAAGFRAVHLSDARLRKELAADHERAPAGLYVHTVKEDPKMPGTLFAGTERGAFISLDDGDDVAAAAAQSSGHIGARFRVHENDLIVGTHGRGIWVIDDISPLRQLDDVQAARMCISSSRQPSLPRCRRMTTARRCRRTSRMPTTRLKAR